MLSLKDADSDRIDDRFDADIHAGADDNGDGILDQLVFVDSNKNGVPDFLDKTVLAKANTAVNSPKTPPKTSNHSPEDSDGDGLSNAIELALGLNPAATDSDGDGLSDLLEVGVNLKSPQDSDRDGAIDAIDPDDDNDGIPTKLEIQLSKTLTYKLDTDNDGVFNYQDANDDGDSRLTKLEGSVSDHDKDGVPDYLDANDGVSKTSSAKVVVLYDKSAAPQQKAETSKIRKDDRSVKVVTSN